MGRHTSRWVASALAVVELVWASCTRLAPHVLGPADGDTGDARDTLEAEVGKGLAGLALSTGLWEVRRRHQQPSRSEGRSNDAVELLALQLAGRRTDLNVSEGGVLAAKGDVGLLLVGKGKLLDAGHVD